MHYRFNAPPGWPVPPEWVPPQGFEAPATWPPAPPNWQWWLLANATPARAPAARPTPASPSLPETAGQDVKALLATRVAALAPTDDGMFGRKARTEDHILRLENFAQTLQQALAKTTAEMEQIGGLDAVEIAALIEKRKAEYARLQLDFNAQQAARADETARAQDLAETELNRVRAELADVQHSLVETRNAQLLQEVGIYEYTHPLDDAVAYKSKLKQIQDRIKSNAREGEAITTVQGWTVNGSSTEGRKMVTQTSKLMLRAYNAEADNLVRTMKPYKLDSARTRLNKTRETIARLGTTMQIKITPAYHRHRLQELERTADYLAKAAEEKERQRELRALEREEEKAQREFAKQSERLDKERAHLQSAWQKLVDNGDTDAAAELASLLEAVEAAVHDVEERQANLGTGYVYVISNRGSFGPNMVKIGMTRRLEPMERIKELGDSSVPFRFDVHALVFTEDAPGLEARLHRTFADQRVNLVNTRREFFYVSPVAVRDALRDLAGEHLLEYTEQAEAYEWHASGGDTREAAR